MKREIKRDFEYEMNKVLLEKMIGFYREMYDIIRCGNINNDVKRLRILRTLFSAEAEIGEEMIRFISRNIFTLKKVQELNLPKQHMSFKNRQSLQMGRSIHICLN